MKIEVFQHVPFEGIGSMEAWFEARHMDIHYTRFFAGDNPLPPEESDGLVIMGGPMSVHDTDKYPFLATEPEHIRASIEAGKPVLGVCLGAQLIALALNARVYPHVRAEIGWFPVEMIQEAEPSLLANVMPVLAEVFHWHGDTFDIPAGAVHLARSKACENQAFSYSNHVLALQFHMEATRELVNGICVHVGHQVSPGPYVQLPEEFLADPERFLRMRAWMDGVLNELFQTKGT